mgnify:CR=1 FL=1
MNATLQKIADELFHLGAFKDKSQSPDGRGFRLKLHEKQPDAPLSPFYLNLRTPENPKPGPLTSEIVTTIGRAFYQRVKQEGIYYHRVAGVPRAGDPLAEAFVLAEAEDSGRPRENPIMLGKEDGAEARHVTRIVAGNVQRDDTVILVDDLITQADSKIEAIEVLTAADLVVKDVLVLVDRQQGGRQQLDERDIQLFALFTITELLDYYAEAGHIPATTRDDIMAYLGLKKDELPAAPLREDIAHGSM